MNLKTSISSLVITLLPVTASAGVLSVQPGYSVSHFLDLGSTLGGQYKAITFDQNDNFYAAERNLGNADIYQFTQSSGYTSSSVRWTHETITNNTRITGIDIHDEDWLTISESTRMNPVLDPNDPMAMPENPDTGYVGLYSQNVGIPGVLGGFAISKYDDFRATDVAHTFVTGAFGDRVYFGRKSRSGAIADDIVYKVGTGDIFPVLANQSVSAITTIGDINSHQVVFADNTNLYLLGGGGPSLIASFDFTIDALASDSNNNIYALESDRDTGYFNVHEISAVPVPAAVWLFVSGLLGLVGVARARSHDR